MLVAIDYDETYTHNPEAWAQVIRTLKEYGYSVIGATLRNRYQTVNDQFYRLCDSVIYCAGLAKDDTVTSFGYKINIWIDDKPRYIHSSYEEIHGEKFHVENPQDDLYIPLEVSYYNR